ncbi:MAG: tetratricopeptide repeat protein [Candidatus Promineofilum sp.]|nr:tetratricopeptide repeat protein [Promineifilum sp.]
MWAGKTRIGQPTCNEHGLPDNEGDLAGARPAYERALAIVERILGPEHPDTAGSLNNLGYLLQAQGDLAGARPYYERALAIRERVLGPEHPATALSLNNLGCCGRRATWPGRGRTSSAPWPSASASSARSTPIRR